MQHARLWALIAAVVAFSWPAFSARTSPIPPSFPWLTAAFAAAVGVCVWAWPQQPARPGTRRMAPLAGAAAAVSALALLTFAVAAWVHAALTHPYGADMLIVIREATARFLAGANPYATYRTYDAPWDVVLPYGPLLWGSYLLPQALRVDLRAVTIVGELAVPVTVAVAAAVEAARGRGALALTWLAVLAALLGSVQMTAFTLMGHTPAYWPMFPLVAWLVSSRRWPAAALALGVMVVARTTMVALVPVLLIAVWQRQRPALPRVCLLLAVPGLLLFTPFALWDPGVFWSNLVTSYPRIVKESVWPAWSAAGVTDTIGVTGWLVTSHLERWAELTQGVAMLGVYAATWRALGRGAAVVPWMAAALTAFSMTALWPVFYLYFDVLLLLASGAAVEALGEGISLRRWIAGVAGIAAAVLLVSVLSSESRPVLLFAPAATQSTYALPRRARDSALIEIDYEAPGHASSMTAVTATLNGRPLRVAPVASGRGTLRIQAPAAAWWRGYNRLDITTAPASAPPLAIARIEVVPLPR